MHFIILALKKIYIIHHTDEWSQIIQSSFSKRFLQLNGTIIDVKVVNIGEKDFRTLILQAKSSNLDAIYAPLVPVDSDLFIKQLRELNYTGYILTGDGLTQDIIDAAGEASDSIYLTNLHVEQSSKLDKLIESYKEKYGEDPIDPVILSLGYDSVFVIIESVKQGSISDGLYKIKDYKGVSGTITINENGGSERAERIFQVQDGHSVLIQ